MAFVRTGDQAVLIVVDTQVGVMQEAWDAGRVVGNIALAVDKARNQGVPVIWVQHSDDELIKDSPEWKLAQGLVPAAGEIRIDKRFNSSFEQTTLDDALSELGATRIVLAGAATNWCIRATAYGALDRGYDLVLLEDAHSTENLEFEDGVTIEAANIIRELNVAMTWVSYPNRTNTALAVGELDFATLA